MNFNLNKSNTNLQLTLSSNNSKGQVSGPVSITFGEHEHHFYLSKINFTITPNSASGIPAKIQYDGLDSINCTHTVNLSKIKPKECESARNAVGFKLDAVIASAIR